MNNHDHELYQNKQCDEDPNNFAQSTSSKASYAVSMLHMYKSLHHNTFICFFISATCLEVLHLKLNNSHSRKGASPPIRNIEEHIRQISTIKLNCLVMIAYYLIFHPHNEGLAPNPRWVGPDVIFFSTFISPH